MRANGFIDAAGDEAVAVGDIAISGWEVFPHHLVAFQVNAALFLFGADREGQIPIAIGTHGFNKFFGDQQRQIELTQTTVFALGADKVKYVWVADIKGRHLRAATTAR